MVNVRDAHLDDVPSLGRLFDAYRQFYGQPEALVESSAFVRDRIAKGDSIILLAEANKTIAGFCQLYWQLSSVRMERYWVLNDLFVSRDARRSGAARALLVAAEESAHSEGVSKLVLETGEDNLPAQSLYLSLGWTRAKMRTYEKTVSKRG